MAESRYKRSVRHARDVAVSLIVLLSIRTVATLQPVVPGEITGIFEGLGDREVVKIDLLPAHDGAIAKTAWTIGAPGPLNRGEAGRFVFTGVPPGRYVLRTHAFYVVTMYRWVTVRPGEAATTNISRLAPCEQDATIASDAEIPDAIGIAVSLTATHMPVTRVFAGAVPAAWLSKVPVRFQRATLGDLQRAAARGHPANFLAITTHSGPACLFIRTRFVSRSIYKNKMIDHESDFDDYVFRRGDGAWDFDVAQTSSIP